MDSFLDDKNFVVVGPWGGGGGKHWDDGVQESVRQIVITYGCGIDSVKFQYGKQGDLFWSEKHGGKGGTRTQKVNLDYPNEYLVAMHGFYGPMLPSKPQPVCVRALSFVSNKKVYGPFGRKEGSSFTFQMVGGQIIGFHGKDGAYLDTIGVYVKHICHIKEQPVVHNAHTQTPSDDAHTPTPTDDAQTQTTTDDDQTQTQNPTTAVENFNCSFVEENIEDKSAALDATKPPKNLKSSSSSISATDSNQTLASENDDMDCKQKIEQMSPGRLDKLTLAEEHLVSSAEKEQFDWVFM